ncbi:OsmC family protein [Halococcus dombrowskii]|uniref:OsmC family protein n=2 Tax=Halococcus dombrowskii TaxID=179637 RepID=A0AAV3SJV5_HALDO
MNGLHDRDAYESGARMAGAMADINVTSTSEDGFATTSRVGGFELTVDATEEEGPEPNGTLVADYASCYIPAFRVGAQQRDYDDLGRIEIDAEGDLDDDEDLEAIRFDIRVEADIAGDEDELVERGEEICHVHSALREELHADISVEGSAF